MAEIEDETPIQATSLTKITGSKINQQIKFFYNDPTQLYYSYVKNDLVDDILDDIAESMQQYLSQDILKINSVDIPLVITATDLEFYKGKKNRPVVTFLIINDTEFLLESGIQSIELEAEKEVLDYPITSSWKLPGKIVEIISPLKHKVTGFQVTFEAKQGDLIGGYEKYTFQYYKKKSKT